MKYTRICPGCGEEFETNHPRQKYCRQVKIKICPICKEPFEQVCEAQVPKICKKPECIKASQSFFKPTNPKICKICGEEFIPKSYRSSYCGKPHKRICKVCGRGFDYICEKDSDPDTCYECRGEQWKRICIYCGKEFITNSPTQQVCPNDHYKTCKVCGQKFKVLNHRLNETINTCGKTECLEAYRSMRIKESQKMLPKGWNVSNKTYTKTCKFCGKEFTTHNSQQLYCNSPHTAICEMCGKEFEISLEQIHRKTTVCSEECRVEKSLKSQLGESVYQTWRIFRNDPENWIASAFDKKPTYYELANSIGVSYSTVNMFMMNNNLEHLVNKYVSCMENELRTFISEIYKGEVIYNDRSEIKPKELDLYIPEFKYGIECNPTISHNSSRMFAENEVTPPSYHKMKTDLCEERGIQLLHIFGYQWTHKQEIVKSMIRNALKCNVRKVYARNCEVREVSYNDCKEFLEHNHIQGNVSSKWRFGLYEGEELVSVMTFGKSRNTIGSGKEDLSDCIELLRFCSLLNTTVVGGASKLFKYAVHTIRPSRVRSFSHRAHTSGGIYSVLRFTEVRRSEPGYMWIDLETDKAYHRYNAQKQNVRKFLHDDTIDLSLSEREIMTSHGFVQVFDSGTITWEWVSESL